MSKLNVSECPHLSLLKAVLDCGKNQANHSAQTYSPHEKKGYDLFSLTSKLCRASQKR